MALLLAAYRFNNYGLYHDANGRATWRARFVLASCLSFFLMWLKNYSFKPRTIANGVILISKEPHYHG
jgi:hypothetical protein